MKKLLLTLGTVAAVAAPVASVIACGSNDDDSTTFKTASNEQETALTKLKGIVTTDTTFGDSITKTEVAGKSARFTMGTTADESTVADAAVVVKRITFNLETGKLVKVENNMTGEFKDVSDEITYKGSIETFNTSHEAELTIASKEALDVISPVVKETPKGDTTKVVTETVVTTTQVAADGELDIKINLADKEGKDHLAAEIAGAIEKQIEGNKSAGEVDLDDYIEVKKLSITVDFKGSTKTIDEDIVDTAHTPQKHINVAINKFIDELSQIDGFKELEGTAYDQSLVDAITAVGPITDDDKANALFKAIGNGSRINGLVLHWVLGTDAAPAADLETAVKAVVDAVKAGYSQNVQDALDALTFA